jgi:hypothetical protein
MLGASAFAAPLCVVDGTLQSYITGNDTFANACQIGDKLFWGFTLTPGPSSQGFEPSAASIQVQPLPGDGLTNIGISFNSGGWIADPGFPIDSVIGFHVAALSGAPVIHDAALIVTGALSGVGTANVTETLSPAVGGIPHSSPLFAQLPGPVSDHIDFSGTLQSTFFVQDEIFLTANTGNAHISIIENDFSELTTPEPLISGLVGSGLLLLGLIGRKRLKR